MIIFKIYTPKRFRITKRLQTTFLKVYFRFILESVPKKIFVIIQTTSMNFFEGYTHDYFQNIHLEKVLNSQTTSENFFEGVFSTLLKFGPKKIFVISRTASMNFV